MSDKSRDPFIFRFIKGVDLKRSPTLLLLHGTGGDENDLLPFPEEVFPTANVLSVRGKVLENGMPRFFRRFSEGVFDMEDLVFRTSELSDFVLESASELGFDPDRVYALGYSNGANIAASMAMLRPEILAGGALLRAILPITPENLPDLQGKEFAIFSGERDPIAPVAKAEALAESLKSCGANVTRVVSPASHQLTQADVLSVRKWFAEAVPSPR